MPEISEEELSGLKANAERAKNLEFSKKRLEEENTKIKARAKEAEEKLSASEKATLEAEGNTQKLLETERAEKLEIQKRYDSRTSDVLREKLRNEISKHAKDAHDVDMVLKVADHKSLLKVDDETLNVDGVKEYVEKVRETHSYLFSGKRLDVENKTGNIDKEFKKEDDNSYADALKACSTRAEMNAVRKKFGLDVD